MINKKLDRGPETIVTHCFICKKIITSYRIRYQNLKFKGLTVCKRCNDEKAKEIFIKYERESLAHLHSIPRHKVTDDMALLSLEIKQIKELLINAREEIENGISIDSFKGTQTGENGSAGGEN